MVLFLGVARALKAMHQYRVKGKPGGIEAQRKAKGIREEAKAADADVVKKAKRRRREDQDQEDIEQEPLMEGEVTRAQEGVGEGEVRAYTHRDIKPGTNPPQRSPPIHLSPVLTNIQRQHHDLR